MTDITHDASDGLLETRRGVAERSWEWARANLFNSVLTSILTLVIAYLIVRLAVPLLNWAIVDSTFVAQHHAACKAAGGACWAFIGNWGRFLLFGRFPDPE